MFRHILWGFHSLILPRALSCKGTSPWPPPSPPFLPFFQGSRCQMTLGKPPTSPSLLHPFPMFVVASKAGLMARAELERKGFGEGGQYVFGWPFERGEGKQGNRLGKAGGGLRYRLPAIWETFWSMLEREIRPTGAGTKRDPS